MKNIQLHYKLPALLVVVLVTGFALISVINYHVTKKKVHQSIIQQDLPLTMNNIYSDLSSELTRPMLVASSMAADTFLKEWVIKGEKDESKIRKYLLEIKEKHNFFSAFFISANTLKYYHFNGINKVISPTDSHDVWYYRFINLNRNYDFEVDVNQADQNILTIFVNYRLEDSKGNLLGVTGVGLEVDSVAQSIKEYKQRYGRDVYLTNRKGLIQVHQNRAFIRHKTIFQTTGLPPKALNRLLISDTPINFEYSANEDKILANARYIKRLNWILFVEQNESKSLSQAKLNLWRTMIIGGIVSALVIAIVLIIINRYQRDLKRLAVSDELTGCANRRKLEEEFIRFAYRSHRSNLPLALIMVDLDNFKQINDTLGHLQGDKVLQTIAQLIAKIIRPTDILVRWGGDEFSILTECNATEVKAIAERIRDMITEIEWPTIPHKGEDPRKNVTASIGIATFRPGEDLRSLQERADQALYQGKKQGRNQVNLAD